MAKLNKARLLKLADVLERGILPRHKNVGFNMEFLSPDISGAADDRTGRHCGSACCIAGWAVFLEGLDPNGVPFVDVQAATWLGISSKDTSQALFFKGDPEFSPVNITGRETNKQAAAVVRHLAETGVVDWGRFKLDGTVRKSVTPTPNNPRG